MLNSYIFTCLSLDVSISFCYNLIVFFIRITLFSSQNFQFHQPQTKIKNTVRRLKENVNGQLLLRK